MPNWCSNALGVTGPADSISRFVKAIKNPDATLEDDPDIQWDLTRPIPMPDILHGTRSPVRTVEEVEVDIARLVKRRAAGELQAHGGYTKEVTSSGSWVTDEYLENMREQARRSILAQAETGYEDWYDWAVSNWGTKWSPRVSQIKIEDTAVSTTFDTAWAPPDALILGLSALFPTLAFVLEYSEPGMGFLGASAYVEGEEVASQYLDSAMDDDPVLAALHEKLEKDLDGDAEETVFDEIHERWNVLQERVGADVSEAVAN